MPKGIPLTDLELASRRQEIAHIAMQLFIKQGFSETSMREIGDAAGVGKSTLYDYFPSKDEILIFYVVNEVAEMTARAAEVMAMDLDEADKMRLIMRRQMEYIIANKAEYLKMTFETQRLSFESQQRIQVSRHAYQDMLCTLVEQGIQRGIFRPVKPLLVVRTLLSLLTTAVFTTRPTGTLEEILDDVFDLIFKGLEA